MAKRERIVKIVVSAEAKGLAQVQSKVAKFQAAVEKTQMRRKSLALAAKDIRIAEQEYKRITATATRYAKVLANERKLQKLNVVELSNVEQGLKLARKATVDAKKALNDKRVALQNLTKAGNARVAQMRATKTAVIAEGKALKLEAVAAASAKVELVKLNKATNSTTKSQKAAAAATAKQTAAMNKQVSSMRKLLGATRAQGAAAKRTAAKGGLMGQQISSMATKTGRGPFGLRPYELTNLSYQINDVVSGLAMGQRPMQIFTQQAGQFLQVSQKLMQFMIRNIKYIILFGAALSIPILAMVRLGKESNNIKYFAQQLTYTGQSAYYSAAALAEIAIQADRTGMSLRDAQKAVLAFTKVGIGEGQLGGFVKMAKQMAKVTGESIPDAAKKLAAAFDDGVESIRKLDKELNFLTADQYEHIIALKEQGDEVGALKIAYDALADRMQDSSDKMGVDGEWTTSLRELNTAWGEFMDWMGQVWLVDMMKASLTGLGKVAQGLTTLLPGGKPLFRNVDAERALYTFVDGDPTAEQVAAIQKHSLQYYAYVKTVAGYTQRVNDGIALSAGELAALEATKSAMVEIQELISRGGLTEVELGIASNAARRAEIEAGIALNDKRQAQQDVSDKNAADMGRAITKSMDEQNESVERSIYLAGLSNEERFVAVGLEKFKNKLADDALEKGEEFVDIDERILAVHEKLLRAQFAAEDTGRGKGSAKRKEEIAEMELVNRLLEYRAQLQSLLEAQELDGDIVGAAQTTEELEQVSVELDGAIVKALMFWEAMGGEKADVAIAKLKELQLELKGTVEGALFTAEFIDKGTTNVLLGAFNGLAKSIAEGQNAIEGFFSAFVKGAGEFLIQIGNMILEMIIMNALQAAFGGAGFGTVVAGGLNKVLQFHDGGTVGAGGSSRMVPSAVFAGAARFHSGGLPGLKSNEVAAILEKGEEVLTRDDSRNIMNGGGSQGDIKVILVNDPAEAQRQNFQDTEYQKVYMEWMQENSNEINSMLGR